jgi:hypothetical protein
MRDFWSTGTSPELSITIRSVLVGLGLGSGSLDEHVVDYHLVSTKEPWTIRANLPVLSAVSYRNTLLLGIPNLFFISLDPGKKCWKENKPLFAMY